MNSYIAYLRVSTTAPRHLALPPVPGRLCPGRERSRSACHRNYPFDFFGSAERGNVRSSWNRPFSFWIFTEPPSGPTAMRSDAWVRTYAWAHRIPWPSHAQVVNQRPRTH